MSNSFPFMKSTQEYLTQHLNKELGTTFSSTDLTYGPVEPIVGSSEVMVLVTPTDSDRYVGSTKIRVKRQDIGLLLSGIDLTLSAGLLTSIYGLLSQINDKYNLSLTEDDVIDQTFELGYLGPIVVNIKPESIIWVGSFIITLIPPAVDIETVIVEGTYTDLVYPASLDTTRVIAEIRFGVIDVTEIKQIISLLSVGDILGSGGEVIGYIPGTDDRPDFDITLSGPTETNISGSVVLYNGPNEGVFFTGDYLVTNICVIELSDQNTKYAGKLILGYS